MLESEATQLAAMFTAMARRLHTQRSSSLTLQDVVGTVVSIVPGADFAGVSVLGPSRQYESRAYTDELVLKLDGIQQEVGEGPCMDAMTDTPVLLVADMEREARWPLFAARACKLGIHSMLSCQFPGEHGTYAALNLHGRHRHAFDSGAVETATVFAAHASIAFAQAVLIESLQTAVYNRQKIGEASGILMERHNITSRQAFEMLVEVSQNSNVKLRDIAADLVSTRGLPGP